MLKALVFFASVAPLSHAVRWTYQVDRQIVGPGELRHDRVALAERFDERGAAEGAFCLPVLEDGAFVRNLRQIAGRVCARFPFSTRDAPTRRRGTLSDRPAIILTLRQFPSRAASLKEDLTLARFRHRVGAFTVWRARGVTGSGWQEISLHRYPSHRSFLDILRRAQRLDEPEGDPPVTTVFALSGGSG